MSAYIWRHVGRFLIVGWQEQKLLVPDSKKATLENFARKPRGGWEETGKVERVLKHHCCQCLIPVTSSWYTPWLVNFHSLRQHLRQSLGFARRVKQTWRACETLWSFCHVSGCKPRIVNSVIIADFMKLLKPMIFGYSTTNSCKIEYSYFLASILWCFSTRHNLSSNLFVLVLISFSV